MSDQGSDTAGFDRDDFDGDERLRALLRSGDPAGSLTPADPAALKSLLEDIMSADLDTRPVRQDPPDRLTAGRSRTTWLVAAAAVAAIAAGGTFAVGGLSGRDAQPPSAGGKPSTTVVPDGTAGIQGQTTELTAGAPQSRCAALTPSILAGFDQAFQGTVTAVEGDTITFQTTDVFTGEVGETVQLTAPPQDISRLLVDAGSYQVGQSYLVSAYQGSVSMCGYSGPATGDLQQVFKEAFVH